MFRSSGSVPALPAGPPAQPSVFGAALHRGGALLEILLAWHDRAAQRLRLAQLDDFALKDMGLSRADVEHETQKPFWRH